MLKIFLKKTLIFLIYGFVWLFIFSIPIKNEKKLFTFLHYYVVDTKPVHWFLEKIQLSAKSTESTAKDTATEFIDKIETEVKK